MWQCECTGDCITFNCLMIVEVEVEYSGFRDRSVIVSNCTAMIDHSLRILLLLTTLASDVFQSCSQYATCADYMEQTSVLSPISNGVYTITNATANNGTTIDVYCAFDYNNLYAWTLIESASRSYMQTNGFRYSPFADNNPREMENVELYRFTNYRLSKNWMLIMINNSNYFYSTCNFDIYFNQDWWLMNINSLINNDQHPLFNEWTAKCTNVISLNIRGQLCNNDGVRSWTSNEHLHIDSGSQNSGCGCTIISQGSIHDEDNFGWYWTINNNFTCVETSDSTTNWWFGNSVNLTNHPTNIPSYVFLFVYFNIL